MEMSGQLQIPASSSIGQEAGWAPEPVLISSSHLRLDLPSRLIPLGFSNKILYSYLISMQPN